MGTELILPDGTTLPVSDRRVGRGAEVRDPRGATQAIGWVSPTMPMVDEWNAEQAFRFGYAANVIAYRCVQLRAIASTKAPFVAGRKLGNAAGINEQSPLMRLLGPAPGGPAPKLSAAKLFRWTHAQKIVTGRRAWEIETADGKPDGKPVAFWPLAAAHLRALPSRKGTEWFRGFQYGNYHDPVDFHPDLVFFGWDPSGVDFRQAESPFQVARYDLSLISLCDRYSLGFLKNNAVPAAVITTTAFPNDAARRKFLANWSAEFGGADNFGRVALNEVGDDGDGPVGDSIDVKVLGLSAKDARLVEQRQEVAHELAIALGTPWSMLDASGRTYDNAVVEDANWWENTILPELIDLQDDINMQLAPRLGSEVGWFDLRAIPALQRRVRPVTQSVGAPALLYARIMQINEARVDYGLEPLADGARFLTDEEVATLQGWGVGGASDANAMRDALAAMEARLTSTRTTEPPALPPGPVESREADPEAIEARRARIWRTADAVVRQLETRWERTWRRMFARQETAAIARLGGKRGRQALGYTTEGAPSEQRAAGDPIDAEQIFTSTFWIAETAAMAQDLYEEAVTAGLTRLSMAFGVDFDLAARWVADFVEARANMLAGQVTQTTYEAIQAELVAGVEAGESIDDLAARIRSVFAAANSSRAATIARTEVISAYNGSAVLGAAQLPADVVAGQEWIATRDGRTRESHASADGQVVAVGVAFEVAGAAMAYPGDPAGGGKNTVNCRCTVAFLTPDEYAEAASRAPVHVEHRVASMALRLVRSGEQFDELGFRRALEGTAA